MAYVFTDNLSTAIIIFGITMGLIFIAHPKVKTIPHCGRGIRPGCCYCCCHAS